MNLLTKSNGVAGISAATWPYPYQTLDVEAVRVLGHDGFQAKFSPLCVPPGANAGCTSCHSTAVVNNVSAKMECTQCHGNPHPSSAVAAVDSNPATYRLEQNYPNPFNPSTRHTFSLPQRETVDLAIYDVHGRLVKSLVEYHEHSAGTYIVDWYGTNNEGKHVASGVYFSRMQAGAYSTTKKMSLVK